MNQEVPIRGVSTMPLSDQETQNLPQLFHQFDAFDEVTADEIDCGIVPDTNGHALHAAKTYVAMRGSTIRVFIKPSTPKATVLQMLEKLTDFVNRAYEEGPFHPNEVVDPQEFPF